MYIPVSYKIVSTLKHWELQVPCSLLRCQTQGAECQVRTIKGPDELWCRCASLPLSLSHMNLLQWENAPCVVKALALVAFCHIWPNLILTYVAWKVFVIKKRSLFQVPYKVETFWVFVIFWHSKFRDLSRARHGL